MPCLTRNPCRDPTYGLDWTEMSQWDEEGALLASSRCVLSERDMMLGEWRALDVQQSGETCPPAAGPAFPHRQHPNLPVRNRLFPTGSAVWSGLLPCPGSFVGGGAGGGAHRLSQTAENTASATGHRDGPRDGHMT